MKELGSRIVGADKKVDFRESRAKAEVPNQRPFPHEPGSTVISQTSIHVLYEVSLAVFLYPKPPVNENRENFRVGLAIYIRAVSL